jgi:[ribosomal protein S18]-alanine N-acetyltransferase
VTPAELAALHRSAFPDGGAWSVADFVDLLATPGAILLTAPGGFLLGRAAGGEAEILTLAVDPAHRRRGIARGLLARFEAACHAAGAATLFLEVAADNAAACALYAGAGYARAGRRPAYYARADGTRADALILRRVPGTAGDGPPENG